MLALSSYPKENVIILFEAVMLVGRTGCTFCIPYLIPRFNTHPYKEFGVSFTP